MKYLQKRQCYYPKLNWILHKQSSRYLLAQMDEPVDESVYWKMSHVLMFVLHGQLYIQAHLPLTNHIWKWNTYKIDVDGRRYLTTCLVNWLGIRYINNCINRWQCIWWTIYILGCNGNYEDICIGNCMRSLNGSLYEILTK